jgi:protein TonB
VAPPPIAPAQPSTEQRPGGNSMGARVLYQTLPEIPDDLRRRNINFVALARFHVAANGSAQVELVEATPEPTLNRELLTTLSKWRFFPAMEQGKPVASVVEIRVPITVK